jgi:SanA protein
MKIIFLKLFKRSLVIGLLLFTCFLFLNVYISKSTKNKIYTTTEFIPNAYTAIVLGAYVKKDTTPSLYLRDRLEAAIELYHLKKVTRVLVSGDHGRKNYDEVNTMKNYLIAHGIPEADVFCDHAGFDTYSSLVRAKKVFHVDSCIIVSQQFHLRRAIYIANSLGLQANAYAAPCVYKQHTTLNKAREKVASVKAFMEINTNASPKYLGAEIPITGDSKLSYD